MTTLEPQTTSARASAERLPRDLGVWVERQTLADLVVEAVQTFYWISTEVTPLANGPERPPAWLPLLTYCYCAGVYATEAILRRLQTDEMLCHLCGHGRFNAHQICVFRGQNREVLKRCLGYVFQRAWATRTEEVDGTRFLGTRLAASDARVPCRGCAPLFNAEAEERIQCAMNADRRSRESWTSSS